MNVKTIQFTKLFFKNALDFKMLFMMTLLFPLIYLVWNHYHLLFHHLSDKFFLNLLFSYWGFIVVMHLMGGANVSLLALKENGFLKMFKFIAGNKNVIIVSNFIAQSLTLFLSLIIFTVITSVLFKSGLWLHALVLMFITFLITIIPISMLFLWIPALNVRLATISPITSLLSLALSFISSLSFTNNSILNFILLLNPVKVFFQLTILINNWLFSGVFDGIKLIECIVVLIIYIVLGTFFLRRITVNSSLSRY